MCKWEASVALCHLTGSVFLYFQPTSHALGASGVTRLQWARVQVFQKGPLSPPKKKQRRANFGPPTALGPRALHALHALLLRHCSVHRCGLSLQLSIARIPRRRHRLQLGLSRHAYILKSDTCDFPTRILAR